MPDPSLSAHARRLERASVRLATETVAEMRQRLAWFDRLDADTQSLVGLMVQSGIRALAAWLRDPQDASRITADVFAIAPSETTRAISLQQTVALVRVAVDVAERSVSDIARPAEAAKLREAMLRFSREIAFATAGVYAHAAEQRGAWDARLEALVVDAVVRGDVDDDVLSRAAALGWAQPHAVTVVAGSVRPGDDAEQSVEDVHRRVQTVGADVLAGVQSQRLVVLVGSRGRVTRVVRAVLPAFGPGPVVTGPVVGTLVEAAASARATFSGLRAAAGRPGAPRPVAADDLLPERALAGDREACQRLVDKVHVPLLDKPDLMDTAMAFLETGGAVEPTARSLFVHPNTVRYRLARIATLTDLDVLQARDRYVAQVGLSLGALNAPRGAL